MSTGAILGLCVMIWMLYRMAQRQESIQDELDRRDDHDSYG